MRSVKRALDRCIDGLMITLVVAIAVLVLLQIVQRHIPIPSVPWTEEMSRYLFVYLTFIGSSLLIKERGHIVVDVLMERVPRRPRFVVYVLVELVVLAFLYIFVSGMFRLTLASADAVAPSMQWFRMSYLYAGVWLGGILMLLYTSIEVVKGVRRVADHHEGDPS
jgi:TRAP-type C4-dicarboxylate transport system permease small subunit